MRGGKTLVGLVVVLLGLATYIYFVESRKPSGGPEEAKPKVFTVDADKISEIAVRAENGDRTTLRKNGANWEIVEPVAAAADGTEVSGIRTSLAALENARVVDENPADLGQYGLAQPRIDLAFKEGSDKSARRLLIGDKTATGGEMYAKTGSEKKVFLVAAYLEGTFNKSTFDLRDKMVLKFERDKVDRLRIEPAGAQAAELALANSEWSIEQPIKAPADYGTVEGVVGRLQSLQMKSIVAQEAADLKAYGLDKPEVTATIGTGSSRASLLVGKKADEAAVYAKDASRPMVVTVEAAILDELKKPADQFRKKDLFVARSYNASSIEVSRGAETFAFEQVKGNAKDATPKWRQLKPAAKDADTSKVETFLTRLSNLRAQSWVEPKDAKAALGAPVMTVTVKFDEGKREDKVTFGKGGADLYAVVAGQPGAAKLESSEFDEAVKALDALK